MRSSIERMQSDIIKKYNNRPVIWLLKRATEVFNRYIRYRDAGHPCISCGRFKKIQAGHFYASGHHPSLRFNENNVHGQCIQCNYYKHGDGVNYRRNLIQKIGYSAVNELDMIAAAGKRFQKKWDRVELIEIIENYK